MSKDHYSEVLDKVSSYIADADKNLSENTSSSHKIPSNYFVYIGIVIISWFALDYFKPGFIMKENDKKEKQLDKQLLATAIISGILGTGFYYYTKKQNK